MQLLTLRYSLTSLLFLLALVRGSDEDEEDVFAEFEKEATTKDDECDLFQGEARRICYEVNKKMKVFVDHKRRKGQKQLPPVPKVSTQINDADAEQADDVFENMDDNAELTEDNAEDNAEDEDEHLADESREVDKEDDSENAFIWPTTEEEMRAEFLADEHRCNGCKAVAFQINKALQTLMPSNGAKRKLSEHEYIEAMECKRSVYDDYGLIKLPDKNKTRVITGPGLTYADYPGSKFGGARWPGRLARFCGELVEEIGGEDEVYRIWAELPSEGDGYTHFANVLCDPYCGGPPRPKFKDSNSGEDAKQPKKKKAAKKQSKENDDSVGESHVLWVEEKKMLPKLVNKKRKFVFLMFCAPSFPRCAPLTIQFQKAANAAKKDKKFKDVRFAIADSDKVGTLTFELDKNILPAFLLFRPGYAAPKGVRSEQMLKLREAGDFLNFMHEELDGHMQDDPEYFPRGKLEL